MREWNAAWERNEISGIRNIPKNAAEYYKRDDRGWISWSDFFGRIKKEHKHFLPFEKAREIVRSLGLASAKEWHQAIKEGLPVLAALYKNEDPFTFNPNATDDVNADEIKD